jgi:hypothetical protein
MSWRVDAEVRPSVRLSVRERTNDKSKRKTSENRAKIDPKSSQNRTKIDPKSLRGGPGALRGDPGRSGALPGRPRDGQKRARASPRALLGRPGASKSALETPRGAPRTLGNAPGELPRRSWSPFVSPNAWKDARAPIFDGFCDENRSFFSIVWVAFGDRFVGCFSIAF